MRRGLPTLRQTLQAIALLVVAVVVGAPVALSTFVHSERHIVIGAHEATIVPVLDGYVTLDFGSLLPQVRLPADAVAGIGVDISLGNADVKGLDQLVARDAIIASQPEGEIAAVRSEVRDMLEAALLRGVGVGVLAAVGVVLTWLAVGAERRGMLRRASRRPSRSQALVAVFIGVVVLGSAILIALPEQGQGRPAPSWVPLVQAFPDVPDDPVLDQLEIVNGSATEGSKALVQGALETYHDSVVFYGALALRATTAKVRQPTSGETTALVVTDRHDNIGMDPVAHAIAVRARAELLIDLGDDTSNGASWETFSINSLAREFRGFRIVSVAGNHDQGSTVTEAMKDRGFTVLDGRPVVVAGIRFLGASDPRSSGFIAGYDGDESDNIAAITLQDKQLTAVACRDAQGVGAGGAQCGVSPAGVRERMRRPRAVRPPAPSGGPRRRPWAERPQHDDAHDGLDRWRRVRVRAGKQAATFGPGHHRDLPSRSTGRASTGHVRHRRHHCRRPLLAHQGIASLNPRAPSPGSSPRVSAS